MLLTALLALAEPTKADAVTALSDLQAGLASFDYERVEARIVPSGAEWRIRRMELVRYALDGRLSAGAVAELALGEWAPAGERLSAAAMDQLVPAGTDPARVWVLARNAAAVTFVDGETLRIARLDHVEVLAPPSPPVDPVPPRPPVPAAGAPPQRADAIALLTTLDTLLHAGKLDAATALVLGPPGWSTAAVRAELPRLVTLGELDAQGVRVLDIHGVWGPAAAVVDAGLVARRAALLAVPPEQLWALALGDARALFGWDGSVLRLAYADDIGSLGGELGLLPTGTPGVGEALALLAQSRGRPWEGPPPRWDFVTRLLGPETAHGMSLRFGVPEAQILVLMTSPPLAYRWDGTRLTLLDAWKAGMGQGGG